MNHLEELRRKAHEAIREARIAEMVSTMFNLEAQFGERKEDVLRRSRRIFPTLTDAAEEAHDYGRAYEQLRHYCLVHDLY